MSIHIMKLFPALLCILFMTVRWLYCCLVQMENCFIYTENYIPLSTNMLSYDPNLKKSSFHIYSSVYYELLKISIFISCHIHVLIFAFVDLFWCLLNIEDCDIILLVLELYWYLIIQGVKYFLINVNYSIHFQMSFVKVNKLTLVCGTNNHTCM